MANAAKSKRQQSNPNREIGNPQSRGSDRELRASRSLSQARRDRRNSLTRMSNQTGLEVAFEAASEFTEEAAKVEREFVKFANKCVFTGSVMPMAKGLVRENHPDLFSTYSAPGYDSSKMSARGQKRARRTGRVEGRKRMRRTGQMVGFKKMRTLPEDLVFCEILPRLPVKSLVRFRSVCKSWHSLISGGDSNLITSHLQRSRQQLRALVMPGDKNSSGVVSCHFSSNDCQSEFLVGMPALESALSTCMPSHCDGLILLSSATDLHICNPSTREFVTLPSSINVNNPSRIQAMYQPYNAASLGYDPLTDKHKVVRFFYRSADLEARTCSLGVEVLTLGSHSLRWIPAQQDPPYPIWPVQQASTVDGVIYWLIDNTLHTSSPQAIVSFDLKDGKFGVIPPPPAWPKNKNLDHFHRETTLHVLDGDLCCTYLRWSVRIVCIYRSGKWRWRHSQSEDIKNLLPLGTSNEGKMLVEVGGTSFHYYDAVTQSTELIPGSTEKWPILSDGDPWFHVMRYTESMISIHGFTGRSQVD